MNHTVGGLVAVVAGHQDIAATGHNRQLPQADCATRGARAAGVVGTGHGDVLGGDQACGPRAPGRTDTAGSAADAHITRPGGDGAAEIDGRAGARLPAQRHVAGRGGERTCACITNTGAGHAADDNVARGGRHSRRRVDRIAPTRYTLDHQTGAARHGAVDADAFSRHRGGDIGRGDVTADGRACCTRGAAVGVVQRDGARHIDGSAIEVRTRSQQVVIHRRR